MFISCNNWPVIMLVITWHLLTSLNMVLTHMHCTARDKPPQLSACKLPELSCENSFIFPQTPPPFFFLFFCSYLDIRHTSICWVWRFSRDLGACVDLGQRIQCTHRWDLNLLAWKFQYLRNTSQSQPLCFVIMMWICCNMPMSVL